MGLNHQQKLEMPPRNNAQSLLLHCIAFLSLQQCQTKKTVGKSICCDHSSCAISLLPETEPIHLRSYSQNCHAIETGGMGGTQPQTDPSALQRWHMVTQRIGRDIWISSCRCQMDYAVAKSNMPRGKTCCLQSEESKREASLFRLIG